jgi:ribosomal protein S18 acetylase RimI-like enzyme
MHIEPFEPKHLESLILQPSQTVFSSFFDTEYGKSLQDAGPCFTAIEDGQVLCCSGVVNQWHNRGIAWALMSDHVGGKFVRIHKAVKRFLESTDLVRIEAYVDADFDAGHRWIQMLGFEREGYAKKYSPQGKDAVLYARVR